MKSILDPKFRYTPSAETDLKKVFARIRKEQQSDKKQAASNVTALPKPRIKGSIK